MSETKKEISDKVPKLTLEGYYRSLPKAEFPKTDFVNKICSLTGVSTATVHNWIHGKTKPLDKKHIDALCEVTGLKEKDLWKS